MGQQFSDMTLGIISLYVKHYRKNSIFLKTLSECSVPRILTLKAYDMVTGEGSIKKIEDLTNTEKHDLIKECYGVGVEKEVLVDLCRCLHLFRQFGK